MMGILARASTPSRRGGNSAGGWASQSSRGSARHSLWQEPLLWTQNCLCIPCKFPFSTSAMVKHQETKEARSDSVDGLTLCWRYSISALWSMLNVLAFPGKVEKQAGCTETLRQQETPGHHQLLTRWGGRAGHQGQPMSSWMLLILTFPTIVNILGKKKKKKALCSFTMLWAFERYYFLK